MLKPLCLCFKKKTQLWPSKVILFSSLLLLKISIYFKQIFEVKDLLRTLHDHFFVSFNFSAEDFAETVELQ